MAQSSDLQAMIDKDCVKADTHGVILRVATGNGLVDFEGSAGLPPYH